MKRLLCAAVLGLLAGALSAAVPKPFDWSSPGEPAYEVLRAAAAKAQAQGWAAGRLAKGEALPQASARELALGLEEDSRLDEATRQALAAAWPSEVAGLDLSPTAQALDALERRMAGLNRRMDALEAALKANNYNAQSKPGFRGSVTGAWISGGGAGLVNGEQRSFPQVNLNLVFAGSNPNFTFELHPYYGQGADQPDSAPSDGLVVTTYGLGFTYGPPDGSWDFQMGGNSLIKTSALVGSAPQGLRPDTGFFLDLAAGNQPTYTTADLSLDLPYGPTQITNVITLERRTATTWWPFTDTLAFFSQPQDLYQSYNLKNILYGGLLRMDLGGGLRFIESNALRFAVTGALVDVDRQRAMGLVNAVRVNRFGWAAGYENHLRDGTQVQAEFGTHWESQYNPTYVFTNTANLDNYSGGSVRGLDRRFLDNAWVATISRPFGPLSLALEAAAIGPFFNEDSAVPDGTSAVQGWLVNGVDANVTSSPGSQNPWASPPPPGGRVDNGSASSLNDDHDLRWGTDVRTPAALGANTQRLAFKGQGGWGWLSFGFALGTATQLRPTSYFVRTSPFFESGDGGRLLYDTMGLVFYQAPVPFAAAPATYNGSSILPSSNNAQYFQWKFNRPTDGMAVYDGAGNSFPAHWQALSQPGYRSIQLALLMTQGGLGDPRLISDSVKAANYAQLQLRFNLQDALRRAWPAELTLGGELRDLAPAAGLPRLDPGLPSQDPQASYLSQAAVTGFLRWGLAGGLQLLLSSGYEHWRSDHGFLPLAVEVLTGGVGADLDLAKLLNGLGLFWRSRAYSLNDLNVGQRGLVLWENSVGTSLTF